MPNDQPEPPDQPKPGDEPKSNAPTSGIGRIFNVAVQAIPAIVTGLFFLIALLIFGIFIFAIYKVEYAGGFLFALQRDEFARGLITFLIAVATVAIAIILALSTITTGGDEDAKERFARGKEILTILIGVLGTIVGFYFGSTREPQAGPTNGNVGQMQALQVIPAIISNEQPKRGEATTISSFLSGGKPPYNYTITFDPNLISPVKASSLDGYIKQDVTIPANLETDTEIKFLIEASDSEGKSGSYNKDGARKILAKAQ